MERIYLDHAPTSPTDPRVVEKIFALLNGKLRKPFKHSFLWKGEPEMA